MPSDITNMNSASTVAAASVVSQQIDQSRPVAGPASHQQQHLQSSSHNETKIGDVISRPHQEMNADHMGLEHKLHYTDETIAHFDSGEMNYPAQEQVYPSSLSQQHSVAALPVPAASPLLEQKQLEEVPSMVERSQLVSPHLEHHLSGSVTAFGREGEAIQHKQFYFGVNCQIQVNISQFGTRRNLFVTV